MASTETPKLLTTGQAAKLCAVTPDTVLKWIRSGLLPARRTAGGHHRIDERELQRVLDGAAEAELEPSTRPFQYCWEYNANGGVLPGCAECAVYHMRAQRCYEVARLAPQLGVRRVFCKEVCEDCDYYRHVNRQLTNVLVVTDDEELTAQLREHEAQAPFNLEVVDCEYACSAVIDSFRPDYAVIDCGLGERASREVTKHLAADPRVPFVRVVLAAGPIGFPSDCDREVFATMSRPFEVRDIAACISAANNGKHA